MRDASCQGPCCSALLLVIVPLFEQRFLTGGNQACYLLSALFCTAALSSNGRHFARAGASVHCGWVIVCQWWDSASKAVIKQCNRTCWHHEQDKTYRPASGLVARNSCFQALASRAQNLSAKLCQWCCCQDSSNTGFEHVAAAETTLRLLCQSGEKTASSLSTRQVWTVLRVGYTLQVREPCTDWIFETPYCAAAKILGATHTCSAL